MRRKPAKTARGLAFILFMLALYLIISLLLYISQAGTPFNQLNIFLKPGAFLFISFSLAAFYVPAFMLICSFMLLKHPFPQKNLVILNLSMIPFVTFVLFLKIATGAQHPDLIINTLVEQSIGRAMGSILFFLLFLFEVVLIVKYNLTEHKPAVSRYRTAGTTHRPARAGGQGSQESDKRAFILELNRLQREQAAGQTAQAPAREARGKTPEVENPRPEISLSRNLALKTPKRSAMPPLPNQQTPGNLLAVPPPAVKHEPAREQKILAALNKDNCEDAEILDAVIEEAGIEKDDAGAISRKNFNPANSAASREPGTGYREEWEEDADKTAGEHAEETIDECGQDEAAADEFPDADDFSGDDLPDDEELEIEIGDEVPDDVLDEEVEEVIGGPDDDIKPAADPALPGADEHKKPAARRSSIKNYAVPVDGILMDYDGGEYWKIDFETRRSADVLMDTLKEFKISAEVTGIRKGPVITMFEILPAPGVKLSKIVNLADNIALRLAAATVRIVAPIPGKHAVGIEVPNKERAIVSFKELITLDIFRNKKQHVPIVIGKDITGEALIIDLVQTPHLLIAGATGSGKSVCVNSIISSILYSRSPDQVKLLLIDPKIVELKFYNDIPHLLTPVVTSPRKAFQALQYCLFEMERRYSLLDAVGVRDINSFNKKVVNKKLTTTTLPYLVIIIDEFADLIATTGKEMEATIARLAAMSRAVGLHLVLATQRPSVDVITGLIKANIPSRIAFMVASKFDSRIIIDSVGAEKLLGRGDMLFSSAWDPVPVRIQGAYLSEEEVEALTGYVKTLGEPDYLDEEIFYEDDEGGGDENIDFGANDPLMEKALEIVVAKGKASASYLQRKLKIGYNRAARLVEEMELRGIVGPPNGSKPRDLLHIPDRKK